MKLQTPYRLVKEDFTDEEKPLVDKLNNPVNVNIEQLYELAKKNVSIRDNISCTVKTFNILVNEKGVPRTPVSVKLDKNTSVIGTQVISANSSIQNVFPLSTPFVTGSKNGDQYNILHIAGLPNNNVFSITIVIYQE